MESSQEHSFRQPNPIYRAVHDLNQRDREHFEVAKGTSGPFNKARFVERFRRLYPRRNPGSIIPSDYCFNRENKGNSMYPRFLLWDGGRKYEFVGLDGRGARPEPSTAPPTPAQTPSPARHVPTRGPSGSRRRFLPSPRASLLLDEEIASRAIREYNRDPVVEGQERSAFSALGRGFEKGKVAGQLVALEAYTKI